MRFRRDWRHLLPGGGAAACGVALWALDIGFGGPFTDIWPRTWVGWFAVGLTAIGIIGFVIGGLMPEQPTESATPQVANPGRQTIGIETTGSRNGKYGAKIRNKDVGIKETDGENNNFDGADIG